MRIALMADIHSNLPALTSVLRAIRAHAPDRIISLGDQVNLGPCPREVLALLRAEGVTCLHGNHERYILSAMRDDPAYAGANFALLRVQREMLTAEGITFPTELRIGEALFCHAMPGDDRFPVFHVKQCAERLSEMDMGEPVHIFCGHGHNPVRYSAGRLTPGAAPYAILDIEHGVLAMQPFFAQYDVRALPGLFRESGMAERCPIMTHITCLQMMRNRDFLMPFVGRANALARAKGESVISEETWAQADREFDWPEGVGTREFWKSI